MAAVHEEIAEEVRSQSGRQQNHMPPQEKSSEPDMNTGRNGSTHISNEKLLAAGGTVAGAAFLGSALGGALGAVAGAAAGLTIAILTNKVRWKEGMRRS
jgi:hypothetical protein